MRQGADVAGRLGLTAGEREVLDLVSTSRGLARIACNACISKKTVQNAIIARPIEKRDTSLESHFPLGLRRRKRPWTSDSVNSVT